MKAAITAAIEDPVLFDIPDAYVRNITQIKQITERCGLSFEDWPTEKDMLEHLFLQEKERHPDILADIPYYAQSCPMKSTSDERVEFENTEDSIQRFFNGELRWANTKDTLLQFAESDIGRNSSSVIAISRQPYALHQQGQLSSALANYEIKETVAEEVSTEGVNVHHALGSLAKYIFEMHDIEIARIRQHEEDHSLNKRGNRFDQRPRRELTL